MSPLRGFFPTRFKTFFQRASPFAIDLATSWRCAKTKMQKKSPKKLRDFAEPTMRFELTTSSLPRKRSTPELRRQFSIQNSRFKIKYFFLNLNFKKKSQAVVGCDFFERKTRVELATFSLEG